VQILVVVATIQRRHIKRSTLKTEVAKVFMTTAIAHELVDPNPKDCERQLNGAQTLSFCLRSAPKEQGKGKQVNIPVPKNQEETSRK